MKSLRSVNHLLNLNYDETLNNELIYNAFIAINALADNIEDTWETYEEKGYYVDEESFNTLNEVYSMLHDLSSKLMNKKEQYVSGLKDALICGETERVEYYITELYNLGEEQTVDFIYKQFIEATQNPDNDFNIF